MDMETYVRCPHKDVINEATKALDYMYNPEVGREIDAAKEAIKSAYNQIEENKKLLAELPQRNKELDAAAELIKTQYLPALIEHTRNLDGHERIKFALVVKYNDYQVRYLVERWMLDPKSVGAPVIPAKDKYTRPIQVGPTKFPETAQDVYDFRKCQDLGAWPMPDPETGKIAWTEVTYKEHGQKAKQVAMDIARKWAPERTFFLDLTQKREKPAHLRYSE